MHRTDIYLDEDQRAALRQLSAPSGETMLDVVRRAIDRLLAEKFVGQDWGTRLNELLARVDGRNTGKSQI